MKYFILFCLFFFIGFLAFSQAELKFNNYSFGTSFNIISENERGLVAWNFGGISDMKKEIIENMMKL
jgi:hypothetical protein